MKIIRPLDVTDAVLTDSNLTETEHSEWSSATTYALGDNVQVTTGGVHSIYESAQASNLNNDPTDATNIPTWWLLVSATNKWKAFDEKIADQTVNTASITYEFTPAEWVNAAAFFNLDATDLNITMTDPTDGEVYNEDYSLVDNTAISNWYDYFFEPIVRISETLILDLPNYKDAVIDVSISVTSGNAEVGEVVLGTQKLIGDAVFGTSVGIQDYSLKERDTFGNAIITARDFSSRVEYDLVINTASIRGIQRTLSDLRATPIVWTGTDDGDYGTLVYGYYKDFDIVISEPVTSRATIEVEGLT